MQPNRSAHLLYEIECRLSGLKFAPTDLLQHQQLRTTALRYAAAGGRPAGSVQKVKLLSDRSPDRWQSILHLWAMDPGNVSWLRQLLAAFAKLQRANPATDFAPIRRWLYEILRSATDD
jgi:hypothetical protein